MIKYDRLDINCTSEDIIRFLKQKEFRLDNPSFYIGNELNTFHKPWDKTYACKGLLCMPVDYGAGINNLGKAMLYNMINEHEDYIMERSYMPDPRLYKYLINDKLPVMFSFESKHPAKDFDFIGISSYFELQFFNIVDMLHKSGIPVYECERDGREFPLVFLGGISAYSCEPVADFIDAAFIGDGEPQIEKIYELVGQFKRGEIQTKDDLLLRMANEVQGCYVPKFYECEYEPYTGPGSNQESISK